jgi:hypothetical protein
MKYFKQFCYTYGHKYSKELKESYQQRALGAYVEWETRYLKNLEILEAINKHFGTKLHINVAIILHQTPNRVKVNVPRHRKYARVLLESGLYQIATYDYRGNLKSLKLIDQMQDYQSYREAVAEENEEYREMLETYKKYISDSMKHTFK